MSRTGIGSGNRNWRLAFAGVVLAAWVGGCAVQAADPAARLAGTARPATLEADAHLVGWWKFDEATGNSAADSSPQPHPAILQDGLAFETQSAPGRMGRAVKLEGKNDGLRVPGFKGVTGPRPRTIAAWIKTGASGGEIVSWGLDDFGKMWTFGHIRGRIGVTPRGGYLYMKAATDNDQWHHVAVVVREAAPPNLHDDVKLYRDGEPAEIDDIGLLDLWPIETGDKLDLRIGRRFKGLLDDLRLYDRPLSDDEVKALYTLKNS